MKLGDIYSKYHVYIGSLNGNPVRKHRGTIESTPGVDITDWDGLEYTFDFSVEVKIVDNKFFIGKHEVGFILKRIKLTVDLMDQATLSGGYVAIDVRRKVRPTK